MEDIPDQAYYVQVGAARIAEIKHIEGCLSKCEHSKCAYQRLPRHMQRRAMSSNPRTLPRSLKDKNQKKFSLKAKPNKRPSRKYRRRPSNLLAEYNRRQRDNVWLETHIWHAKRFGMKKLWNYSVAHSPTNKSYRSSLRAASESCLIQDISYEVCIECEGPVEVLMSKFTCLFSAEDMGVFSQPDSLEGRTTFVATMHKPFSEPYGAIGAIDLLWHPARCCGSSLKKLWMWVHPSIYEEVVSIMIALFDLSPVKEDAKSDDKSEANEEKDPSTKDSHSKPILDRIQWSKLALKNIPHARLPKYISATCSDIKFTLLKDTLNKFRLIGPLSHEILRRVLILSDVNDIKSVNDPAEGKLMSEDKLWWTKFYSNAAHTKFNQDHFECWESLCQSSLHSKFVFSFIVRDVRVLIPMKKRTLTTLLDRVTKDGSFLPPDTRGCSPIFDECLRNKVTMTLDSTEDINKQRSQFLVPGMEELPLTQCESRVPILLLFRPSVHSSGLGSGWDLILPAGVGASMWLSLVLNGAAPGGQLQSDCLQMEFLLSPPPHHMPDTSSCKNYDVIVGNEQMENYFKRPPNCRPNYIKLGIQHPFQVDWGSLLKSWFPGSDNFFVLRNKKNLAHLAEASCKKLGQQNHSRKRKFEGEELSSFYHIKNKRRKRSQPTPDCGSTPSSVPLLEEIYDKLEENGENSLVYVRLVVLGKGSLEPLSHICIPTDEDKATLPYKKKDQNGNYCLSEENMHQDPNAQLRGKLKENHKRIQVKLSRLRKKSRMDIKEKTAELSLSKHLVSREQQFMDALQTIEEENKELVEEMTTYNKRMTELWLIDKENDIQMCARKIFGYVLQGGFCARMGRSGGVGYVVLKPLLSLMQELHRPGSSSPRDANQPLASEEFNSSTPTAHNSSRANILPKGGIEQIHVLVRNPTSQKYLWARLVIINTL